LRARKNSFQYTHTYVYIFAERIYKNNDKKNYIFYIILHSIIIYLYIIFILKEKYRYLVRREVESRERNTLRLTLTGHCKVIYNTSYRLRLLSMHRRARSWSVVVANARRQHRSHFRRGSERKVGGLEAKDDGERKEREREREFERAHERRVPYRQWRSVRVTRTGRASRSARHPICNKHTGL